MTAKDLLKLIKDVNSLVKAARDMASQYERLLACYPANKSEEARLKRLQKALIPFSKWYID